MHTEQSRGRCGCGCGQETPISDRTVRAKGYIKGEPHKFIPGHNGRTKNVVRYIGRAQARTHIVAAEKALGRPLPPGVEVHHVNRNTRDNRPGNLVICQDRKYHHLLHVRQRALTECGRADWRKCWICRTYDDPRNLYIRERGNKVWHVECSRRRKRERGAQRRPS